MKIGINGRFLCNGFTGIGNYTRNVIVNMALYKPNIEFIVIVPCNVNFQFPNNVKIIVIKEIFWLFLGGLKKSFWEQIQVIMALKKEKVNLMFFPYPSTSFFKQSVPVVTTVHDTIPWELKEYSTGILSRFYHFMSKRALFNADKILTVSSASKKDIVRVCNVNFDDVVVVYNGIDNVFLSAVKDFSVLSKYGVSVERKFILYVGGFDKRKNVDVLIDVFLNKIAPFYDVDLVIAGGKVAGGKLYDSLDYAEKVADNNGKILLTGFVDDKDLPAFYQKACLFVSLSSMEGFNLPLVEASVSGCPVIASDIEVHREVLGEYGVFVDFKDLDAVGDAILKVVVGKKEVKNKFNCNFSWSVCGEMVLDLFLEII